MFMTYRSIRGVSLFVKIMGQGYPVLLMHGGPGLDYKTMLPLEPLADQFSLVFYDHRCNGQSEGAEISSMTWENLTADADGLRQALGFEKWAVLGHSFGGNVALEYALRYPQSLSHLILMDTGGDQWWVNQNAPRLLAKRGYSEDIVKAAHRFYSGEITPDEFVSISMMLSKAYNYDNSIFSMDEGFDPDLMPKFKPEALIYGYSKLLKDWTVMDRLDEVKVPTLVMAGRHDFLFPPEHQAILADRLPNARLEIIEQAGHNPHMEQQTETIRIIREFISSTKPDKVK
jgi:pimeloyl-ACP methyl ester carboxylesterase